MYKSIASALNLVKNQLRQTEEEVSVDNIIQVAL